VKNCYPDQEPNLGQVNRWSSCPPTTLQYQTTTQTVI